MLWGLLLLSLEVTYYASQSNVRKFENAWSKYDESSWDYFGKIRSEISKARRLTSPETHDALLDVYNAWFMDFDLELTGMANAHGAGDPGWSALHHRIYDEGVVLIDDVLTELAQQLQLTRSDVRIR